MSAGRRAIQLHGSQHPRVSLQFFLMTLSELGICCFLLLVSALKVDEWPSMQSNCVVTGLLSPLGLKRVSVRIRLCVFVNQSSRLEHYCSKILENCGMSGMSECPGMHAVCLCACVSETLQWTCAPLPAANTTSASKNPTKNSTR